MESFCQTSGLPQVFVDRRAWKVREAEEERARLYEQIGRLKVEIDWLKKKLGLAQ
jgi:putative transposase